MHPAMLRQLAADHIRELITEAGDARRANPVRRARWHRPPTRLRRSTRLYAQQRGSRPEPRESGPEPRALVRSGGPGQGCGAGSRRTARPGPRPPGRAPGQRYTRGPTLSRPLIGQLADVSPGAAPAV